MNNAVILNKDVSTWPRIKKYWEERGVDCSNMKVVYDVYYGFIDGCFSYWSSLTVECEKAEIIELPEEKKEKKYPRVMWVWDKGGSRERRKRVVFMEKKGRFLSWVNAETIEESERMTGVSHWDYASEILPEIEVTLEEIAAWKGVSKEQVKIKQ